MSRFRWIMAGLAAGLCALGVLAQDITPATEPTDPNFGIIFPPPVYVLNSTVEIRGSASVPNMTSYFIEFRPLTVNPAEVVTPTPNAAGEEAPWFPASLPATSPVQDGVLGTWNTNTAPDGLYELRLTVNLSSGEQSYFRVSPLRIDNTTFVPPQPSVEPTRAVEGRPTLVPSPTAPTGGSTSGAQVTANVNANVRIGDSTAYGRVGTLLSGQSADILGVSPRQGGWYYIRLSNGSQGFIAPSTVTVSGDTSNLPPVNPPPVPTAAPTSIPTIIPTSVIVPTAGPTAVPAGANLAIQKIVVDPVQPVCNGSTLVSVTVINNGTALAPAFSITAADRRSADGSTTQSTRGAVPALNAGSTFTSEMYLTISTFYSEAHTISVSVDSGAQVVETNEGDNVTTYGYNLAQGGC